MPEELPPRELMVRFQRTLDDDAFEQIFSRFYRPAVVVARRMLRDDDLAEDAVQQSLLKVVRRRNSYDPDRPFAPWFYAIVRNQCRDLLRRQGSRASRNAHPAEAQALGVPDRTAPPVLSLLERLPRGQRAVLELRIIHGLPFRDVGVALDISEEAAKKRAQRGLRRLRELYFRGTDRPQGATTLGIRARSE